jgi:hypothetical protein
LFCRTCLAKFDEAGILHAIRFTRRLLQVIVDVRSFADANARQVFLENMTKSFARTSSLMLVPPSNNKHGHRSLQKPWRPPTPQLKDLLDRESQSLENRYF